MQKGLQLSKLLRRKDRRIVHVKVRNPMLYVSPKEGSQFSVNLPATGISLQPSRKPMALSMACVLPYCCPGTGVTPRSEHTLLLFIASMLCWRRRTRLILLGSTAQRGHHRAECRAPRSRPRPVMLQDAVTDGGRTTAAASATASSFAATPATSLPTAHTIALLPALARRAPTRAFNALELARLCRRSRQLVALATQLLRHLRPAAGFASNVLFGAGSRRRAKANCWHRADRRRRGRRACARHVHASL